MSREPVDACAQLKSLADELERIDYDTTHLRELTLEAETLQLPPSLLGRLRKRVAEGAARQWQLILGELAESKEALAVIRSGLRGERLNAAQKDQVKAQLYELGWIMH